VKKGLSIIDRFSQVFPGLPTSLSAGMSRAFVPARRLRWLPLLTLRPAAGTAPAAGAALPRVAQFAFHLPQGSFLPHLPIPEIRVRSTLVSMVLVALPAFQAAAQCQVAGLVAPESPPTNARFGSALGLQGGMLAVGARNMMSNVKLETTQRRPMCLIWCVKFKSII